MKDKESEIAALRAAIAAKEQNVVGETLYSKNRLKDALSQQLLAKQVAVEAATAKRKALIAEKKSYEDRLDVLKDRTFDLGRLRGDFDLARETYFMYEKKAEEARVSRAMDEENIVNAGVIQEAEPADHPAAPQSPDLGSGVGRRRGRPRRRPRPRPGVLQPHHQGRARHRAVPPGAGAGHRPPLLGEAHRPLFPCPPRDRSLAGVCPRPLVLGGSSCSPSPWPPASWPTRASPAFVPLVALALIGGALVVWRPEIGRLRDVRDAPVQARCDPGAGLRRPEYPHLASSSRRCCSLSVLLGGPTDFLRSNQIWAFVLLGVLFARELGRRGPHPGPRPTGRTWTTPGAPCTGTSFTCRCSSSSSRSCARGNSSSR